MKRGDVFSVKLRGNAGKPRPGIIVQTNELIRSDQPVLVCPLTSVILDDAVTRPMIQPTTANGLRVASQVMVNRMTSAEVGQIGAVIGTLSDDDMSRVDLALMVLLGLAHRLMGQS